MATRPSDATYGVKAILRVKVEYQFQLVKNLFKHKKTHYRGLAKNALRLQYEGQWRAVSE